MSTYRVVAHGDMTADQAEQAAAYLRAQGWPHVVVIPQQDEERIPDDTLVASLLPSQPMNDWNNSVDRLLDAYNISTLASLRKVKCSVFLASRNNMHVKSQIIRVMIKTGTPFADVDPADLFCTPLEQLFDLTNTGEIRVYNALSREGIAWIEMLACYTRLEVADIRNLGELSVARINDLMEQAGVSYKDE